MRGVILFSLILSLAACGQFLGAGVKHYTDTNSGKETYELTCTGAMVTMDTCIQKAQDICPRGYVQLQNHPEAEKSTLHKEWLHGDNPDLERHLIVQCKE